MVVDGRRSVAGPNGGRYGEREAHSNGLGSLLELEQQRDRDEAAYRASVIRIADALEQLLDLLKSREVREQFR